MNIEIITPNDGWILHRMAQRLAERLPDVTLPEKPSGKADLTYFLHYHMYRPVDTPTAAFFTHRESPGHPLQERWTSVAAAVDLCISMSDTYAADLPAEKTVVILPGIDERFKPRKLRVGTACQWAHGNEHRKGLDLLLRLEREHSYWIDLRLTNGEVPDEDMVRWYQDLDVYLVASRYEGGPITALEAAACGVFVVAPKTIGLMNYLYDHHGFYYVTDFEAGNFNSMLEALRYVNQHRYIDKLAEFKTDFSWDRFARQHHEQFEKLLKAEAVK